MRTKLFRLTSLLVLLSMIVVPLNASIGASSGKEELDVEAVNPSSIRPYTNPNASVIGRESDTGLYIVRFAEASLAAYKGGISGLEATSPEVTGARKVDVNSPSSQAYLSYLESKQADAIGAMQAALGRPVEVAFQYLNVLNGMAVYANHDEATKIAGLPGVVAVYADKLREMDTDVGPFLITADSIWNGETISDESNQGEGIIIGMIDSGINHAHPSFADPGGDGYDHENPNGSGNYFGYCDTDDATFCNDKLIGAYGLNPVGASPEDSDGHGSHTASTAGGNRHDVDLGDGIVRTIQGVAPHANIIAYKVCNPGCPGSASVAAVNLAIENGVDVLNYSISGGDDPWNDPVDIAFLDAYANGIFVSASAGNNGVGTVAKTGPWNASVGASTHNRVVANTLDVVAPSSPPELTNLAVVPGEGTSLTHVLSGDINYDPDNLNGCEAFPAGYFTDIYALIQRGGCTFVTKVDNAEAAGAVGVVVFNNVGGPPITMGDLDGSPPAVMLDLADGTAVKDYIDTNAPTPVGIEINDELSLIFKDEWEDIMAGFSSTGPSQWELVKPDYIAPGVNILAAVAAEPSEAAQYGFYQGTSMASPHSAGAAALMIALNPDWSPAEVKSAMASTAYNGADIYKPDGVTSADVFDMGSGRLDLSRAGYTGFVLDETYDNYVAANPETGGEPKTLNQPSVVDYQCLGECSWTRVISSTLPYSVTWTTSFLSLDGVTASVEPSVFELGPYASQTITITADSSGASINEYSFGDLLFTPSLDSGMAPAAVNASADFTSTPAAAIPDDAYNGTLASMACDVIDTSSEIPAGSVIDDVQLSLAVSHPRVQDLVTKLISPDDSTLGVFSRPGYAEAADDGLGCCGDNSNLSSSSPLSFGDAYSDDAETMGDTIETLGVICEDDGRCTYFPNPGAVSGLVNFAGFAGESASGSWELCLGDALNTDTGTFQEWVLTVDYTPPPVEPAAAHFPMTVVNVVAQLPDSVEIETRRNAGSELLPENYAIEITDLTAEYYGFVQADLTTEMLSEDPTNGDPYDNLNDGTVFYITQTVPANAYSLIAEVTESEAPDVDLFVGEGDTPSGSTLLCSSTTPSWDEACNLEMPSEGTYWILVQNWTESGDPPDLVTLSSAVVTTDDAGNMMVEGPAAVQAGDPFDLRVYWDTPEMMAGDRWYGAFTLGTDPGNPGNLGTVPVTIIRAEDDVIKEASAEVVLSGDTVTYTISVQPNITSEDLTYALTDTIPAGLSYVDGSASASTGEVEVTGDTLTWTGVMPVPSFSYEIETSLTDPACAVPLANSGAYTDLQQFGIGTESGIEGDTVWYGVNFAGGSHNLFGGYYGENVNFTDDGFAFLDPSTPGDTPWTNQPIPTVDEPNNLMAMFWRDMEIVYHDGQNRGVSLANITSDGVPTGFLIEYDDVEDWPAGETGTTYDFEIFGRYDPGDWYEYIFAYDNLNGDVSAGTIGLENVDGTVGVQYAFDDIAVTDGMAVCFDLIGAGDEAIITYAVTVDGDVSPGADLTNNVVHNTDAIGSLPAVTSDTVHVQDVYGVELTPAEVAMSGAPGERVEYSLTLTNSGSLTDTFDITFAGNLWNVHLPETTITLGAGESIDLIVHVDVPEDAEAGDNDMVTVTATSESDVAVTASSVLTTTASWNMYFLPFVP